MQSTQAGDIATLRTTLGTRRFRAFAGQADRRGGRRPRRCQLRRLRPIHALNQQADAHPACVYAKNLVASAIRDIVTAYRAANPNLADVVLVGDDDVIPFFRYPDQNGLGPEKNYQPPVDPTSASEASLRSDYILGQDEYGSKISLSLGTYAFPVPDLPVGRLVETPGEATGSCVPTWTTRRTDSLLQPEQPESTRHSSPATTSSPTPLRLSMTLSRQEPARHPDSTSMQRDTWTGIRSENGPHREPPRPDLLGWALQLQPRPGLPTTPRPSTRPILRPRHSVNLTNSIVFSAGCHSGYNLVDGDQLTNGQPAARLGPGVRPAKGATLIAGTGYQYGDSDSRALEREDLRRVRPPAPDWYRPGRVGSALDPIEAALSRLDARRPAHGREGTPPVDFLRPADAQRRPAAAGRVSDASGGSAIGSTALVGPGPGHDLELQTAPLTTSTQVSSIHTKTLNNHDRRRDD